MQWLTIAHFTLKHESQKYCAEYAVPVLRNLAGCLLIDLLDEFSV